MPVMRSVPALVPIVCYGAREAIAMGNDDKPGPAVNAPAVAALMRPAVLGFGS